MRALLCRRVHAVRSDRCALVTALASPCLASRKSASSTASCLPVFCIGSETIGTSAIVCAQRFYTTSHSNNTDSHDNENASSAATAKAAASDDASDLLWSSLEAADLPFSNSGSARATTSTSSSDSAAAEAKNMSFESRGYDGAANEGEAHPFDASRHDSRSAGAGASSTSAAAPQPVHVWVALHNMPRNWLHEDIIEFVHQAASHAGIEAPHVATDDADGMKKDEEVRGETEAEANSAVSHVKSPFVHHLHIPFGRRTGLVYGSPKLLLSSAALAAYLTTDLVFEPDDFRSRMHFTKLTPSELPASFHGQHDPLNMGGDGAKDSSVASGGVAQVRYTPIEETVDQEQQEALRTLDLDRYLFAPDLLLDIAKLHQRRLVTKNEKVLLDAFVDGEEDAEDDEDGEDDEGEGNGADDDDDGEGEGAMEMDEKTSDHRRHGFEGRDGDGSGVGKKRKQKGALRRKRKTKGTGRVRAGTQKHMGRGSMHNMPIPKPYVEGRRL